MDCAHCAHTNPPEARFCAACGTSLAAGCPNCGASTAAGQRFCTACGVALAGGALVEPPTLADGERRHATVVFSDLVHRKNMRKKLICFCKMIN